MSLDAETVIRLRTEELAAVLGRVRRRVAGDEYLGHLLDIAGGHVEVLHQVVSPTAAEMYVANIQFGADDETAVVAALEDADGRVRRLRGLLGRESR